MRIFIDISMLIFAVQIIFIIIIVNQFHSVNGTKDTIFQTSNKTDPYFKYYSYSAIKLSNNTGHSEVPQIAGYGNNVYVAWHDDTSGDRDVYTKRSTDNGCAFSNSLDLSNQSGASVDQQIAVSGSNVYVIWEQLPRNNGSIFFTRSTDNGTSFDTIQNLGNNTV